MITFLTYQLKVAVIMAVFYIFFRLLLIKDSWHRLNRIVLLSTALLSLLLPVCIITIHKTEVLPVPMTQLMQAVSSTPAQPSTPWWHIALMAVYAAGVTFVLARVLASALRVRRLIRHARKEVLADGTTVYVMPGNDPSFSWMGHIVISEADWRNNETAIINHEKAHVALHHSIDVLITDIIAALQWFNPAIWMLRIDLRAVHEYEADDTVLRAGTDIRSYQYLLISKAAAMNGYTIANNFNHSILKNRIIMMEKETSTGRSLLRALYLLPLVCISLALNAQTKVDYVNDDKTVTTSVVVNEIKLDGEAMEGLPLDRILNLLPDLKKDANGKISTSQGSQVQKIIVNGKVLYGQEATANAEPAIPRISVVDSGSDMNIDFSGYSSESVDKIIKALPGAEFDDDGTITVNGKTISKVLVGGQPYTPQEVVETLSEPSASTGKNNSIYDLLTGSDKLDMSITIESDPITVSSSSSDPSIDILKALYQARIDGMDEQTSKKTQKELKQLERNLNKANNRLVRMERRQERQLTRNLNRFLKQNPDAIDNPELIPQELMTKKSINAKVSTKKVDLQALGLQDFDLTQRVMSDVSVDSQNNMFINGHKVSRILINGEEITPEQFEELASLVSPQE